MNARFAWKYQPEACTIRVEQTGTAIRVEIPGIVTTGRKAIARESLVGTVTIDEARAHLAELIEQLHPGESIVITRGDSPVALLVAQGGRERPARELGTLRGTVRHM